MIDTQQESLGAMVLKSLTNESDKPVWEGPSSEGPQGGITQSLLARWLVCRERFRAYAIKGLKPFERWEPRTGFGNMWHVCEEAEANSPGSFSRALLNHYSQQRQKYLFQADEIGHWVNVVSNQFPQYLTYWQSHNDDLKPKTVGAEQTFDEWLKLPSGRKVRLRGKYDLIFVTDQNSAKGAWLQENKCKAKIDESMIRKTLRFDLQTGLYITVLHHEHAKLGIQHEDKRYQIRGVRYNVIRRDCPIRQHKPKKSDPLGESAEHFYERLRTDYFESEPEHWFYRWDCFITAEDRKRFVDEFLYPALEQLCHWYDVITDKKGVKPLPHWAVSFRMPYGVYNYLAEDRWGDYDNYLLNGGTTGLTKTDNLFRELTE